jgi:hypothetical protein
MTTPVEHAVEYRFNRSTGERTCPLCGTPFRLRLGMWPVLAGTDTPVCGGDTCPIGEEVTGPTPCDTLFEFVELEQQTLDAIGAAATDSESVAETLRHLALDESLPEQDRNFLTLAAIDLQYCEASTTRIARLEPRLVLRTCGEAAAELLLSGCGDIL